MTPPEGLVVLGNFVRTLIGFEGAELVYKPTDVGGGKYEWTVFVRRPDGAEMQVFIGRTGQPKRLKSANAVVSYHQSLYPDATEVRIPVLPRGGEALDPDEDG